MNPDLPCPHENFDVRVVVNCITDTDDGPVTGYSADIKVNCGDAANPSGGSAPSPASHPACRW